MNLICMCGLKLVAERNMAVIELFQDNQPYKIYSADKLICKSCGAVILRTADKPFAEHFQENFEEVLKKVEEGPHMYWYDSMARIME